MGRIAPMLPSNVDPLSWQDSILWIFTVTMQYAARHKPDIRRS